MTMQSGSDKAFEDRGGYGEKSGMDMDLSATSNVPKDAHVFTSDGEELGTAGEHRGGHFKVKTSMAPDYWVNLNHVTSVMGDRVTLNFAKDHLDQYKDDKPNDSTQQRHAA